MNLIYIYDAEIEVLRQAIEFLNSENCISHNGYFTDAGLAGKKLRTIYNRALGMTDEEERNAV